MKIDKNLDYTAKWIIVFGIVLCDRQCPMNGRMRKNANAITSSCFVGVTQLATLKIATVYCL